MFSRATISRVAGLARPLVARTQFQNMIVNNGAGVHMLFNRDFASGTVKWFDREKVKRVLTSDQRVTKCCR